MGVDEEAWAEILPYATELEADPDVDLYPFKPEPLLFTLAAPFPGLISFHEAFECHKNSPLLHRGTPPKVGGGGG